MNVLITGTTSGIGKCLANDLLKKNFFIIHVNRGSRFELCSSSEKEIFIKANIISLKDIELLLKKLIKIDKIPEYFYLNAGVNLPDINSKLEICTFQENFNINFYGSLNFISSSQKLKLLNKTFILFSSTSNIVPNPCHFGYFLSKYGLFKATSFLSASDKDNIYKCIILGPINTNISRNFKPPQGFQKFIFKLLIVEPDKCVKKIIEFSLTKKKFLFYPLKAIFIYYIAKFFIKLFPKAYNPSNRSE